MYAAYPKDVQISNLTNIIAKQLNTGSWSSGYDAAFTWQISWVQMQFAENKALSVKLNVPESPSQIKSITI